MFFQVENERLMICSDTQTEYCPVEIIPPDDFDPEYMCNWKYINGELIYTPPVVEPSPIDRIAALEEQNKKLTQDNENLIAETNMLVDCLLEMSMIVYA